MFGLAPFLGNDFFPATDGGQFILHMRAKTGTRAEETARLADLVEQFIRTKVPEKDVDNIIDIIGLPYSGLNTMYSSNGLIGPADADIMVSLKEGHRPTADYVRDLRATLNEKFPAEIFYFLPADMVTQILNFGQPAPIDIQVEGNDMQGNRKVAEKLLADIRQVAGVVDAHVHEPFDYPTFNVNVDRTKAARAALPSRTSRAAC